MVELLPFRNKVRFDRTFETAERPIILMLMKATCIVFLMLFSSILTEEGVISQLPELVEETKETILETKEPYQLQEGEEFDGSEFTVTVGANGLVRTSTEHKLDIKDGQLIDTTYARRSWIDPHLKVQKVKKIIITPVTLSSVYEVVKAYSEEYGKPLSDLEFQLFNTIAITEGNHFHINYIVRQIKRSQLSFTLRKMIRMFSIPLTEDDIAGWIHEIDQNCTEKYKVFPLDTSSAEIHRKNKWLVRTEVLMATCGQPGNVGFQLFAWAAYKEGAYKPAQYSVENSETVDSLITRWLYANMRSMIDCERDDSKEICKNEESSTLSEFSISDKNIPHVNEGDQWKEHGNSDGIFNSPDPSEEVKKPNPDLSDKPVWNGKEGNKEPSQSGPGSAVGNP